MPLQRPTMFSPVLPILLAGTFALAGLAGCDQPKDQAQTTATVPASSELKLERVVMLMRHGVRPPTRAPVTPPGTHAEPWPAWPVDFGELTPRGYDAVRLLGH